MNKKEIVMYIGNSIISLGNKAVRKSIAFGMYEPDIPDILRNEKEKYVNNSTPYNIKLKI